MHDHHDDQVGDLLADLGQVQSADPAIYDRARETLWTAIAADMLKLDALKSGTGASEPSAELRLAETDAAPPLRAAPPHRADSPRHAGPPDAHHSGHAEPPHPHPPRHPEPGA